MQTGPTDSNHRIYFFDNLRYFMVLLVVVFHAICSYSSRSPWWTVNDSNFFFFAYLSRFLNTFLMPMLFFIAGYFGLQSHQKKTTWGFIKSKLKRLGIPFLIGVILLNPVQMYIWEFSRGIKNVVLWEGFLFKMESALSFHIGYLYSAVQFSLIHFWFISLLLLFFIVFALIGKIKDMAYTKSPVAVQTRPPSNRSIFLIILCAGILVIVLNLCIPVLFPRVPPGAWMMIGNIIQFQTDRLILFIVCFCLGIYAYHKKWFLNGEKISGYIIGGAVCIAAVLWFCLHAIDMNSIKVTSNIKETLLMILIPSFFFSMFFVLITFGMKYWDSSSKINRLLSDNSYNIYLIHMVFIYVSQCVLVSWPEVPPYVKAVFVCVFSVSTSLLISHYAMKKSPGFFVAGLVGVFALLLIILR